MNLVAYRTTRKGKGPLPDTQVLAAQDEGEFWRTRTQFIPPAYAYRARCRHRSTCGTRPAC